MEIIYKNKNEELFISSWIEYIKNNRATFNYLLSRIDINLLLINDLLIDSSFVVIENNKCLGICFLPIEKNKNYNSITLSNGYTISPLFQNKKVEKFIFDTIDEIAKKNNVKIIKFYNSSLIDVYQNSSNYFLKYNFINTSTTTGIVDLTDNNIWTNIRKHYKSMINKVLKDNNFSIYIMNNNNADYAVHEKYRFLHEKCAGRVTRIKKTFDKQFEMLQNGFATMIGLKYNNIFIGMQYFFHFQKTVIYGSGADDPEYTKEGFNIYHPILWEAQKYFKDNKFEYLDYSQPFGYSLVQGYDDYYDEKQLNISYFKRGMGAEMKTLNRGIKYIDKDLLLKDINMYKDKVLEL